MQRMDDYSIEYLSLSCPQILNQQHCLWSYEMSALQDVMNKT